ncbi:MAG: hypothetical protein HC863_01760 [Myxococcales bacterium]|nr:hypothetical protein [Myxococcales bacterium]
MKSALLVTCLVLLFTSSAMANGRPPGAVGVRVENSKLVVSTTFGFVTSTDAGATWDWICETALEIGGTFDPPFELSKSTSQLLLSGLDGLLVSRDSCAYGGSGLGKRYVGGLAIAANGDVLAAASDNDGSKIYRSTDDGMTFAQASPPFRNFDSWNSLAVAGPAGGRVYVSGIRLALGQPKKFLLYRSLDGGTSFVETKLPNVATASLNAILFIAGVSPTNPDVLYARLTEADGMTGEELFRSADAGETWTSILKRQDSLAAFVVRKNGDLIVGTPSSGALRSTDQGATFSPLTGAPHLNCLIESADQTLYGCTQNYGAEGDDAAVMKSTDGVTWSKVLRFQDIRGPVACAAGTVQKDTCEAMEWCATKDQLGITSTAIDCAAAPDGGAPMPSAGGCCNADGRPQSLVVALLAVLWLALRGRRKRLHATFRATMS